LRRGKEIKIKELWDKFKTVLFIISALITIILFVTIPDVRNFIGNILKSVGLFLGSMFKLTPPDILLLILILGILVWLFLLGKKVRGFSKENIKEVLEETKRLWKINNKLREKANDIISENKDIKTENHRLKAEIEEGVKKRKEEPISIDDFKKRTNFPQYVQILFKLGGQFDTSLEQRKLSEAFEERFQDKSTIDFNTAIGFLQSNR